MKPPAPTPSERWSASLVREWPCLRRLTRADEGQDLLEYGLLMALIAIVAVAAVSNLGATINAVFWQTIAANF